MSSNIYENGNDSPVRILIPDMGPPAREAEAVIRRNPRSAPPAPAEGIYDRARIIFSRARAGRWARSANIF